MTRAAALAALYTCIAALSTSLTPPGVIWAHEAQAPAVVSDHIRLTVISEDRVGFPYRVNETTLRQSRVMDVQIDGIGVAASELMLAISALLYGDHPALRTMWATGVSIQGISGLIDLSEKGQTGWIRRKSLTITAGYLLEISNVAAGPAATAINVALEADSDGDGVIDHTIDPAITVDLT